MDGWMPGVCLLTSCAVGTGMISATELALTGQSAAAIRRAVDSKLAGARSLLAWRRRPTAVLNTLQFLRLFCVGSAGVAVLWLADGLAWSPSIAVFAASVVALLLVTSHLVSRRLVRRQPLSWARHTIRPVRLLSLLLLPLVWPLSTVSRLLPRAFGVRSSLSSEADGLPRDDVQARAEALHAADEDLLLSIIEFSDTVIREIMVPRTEMVAIHVDSSTEELNRTVVEGNHSRVPVYSDTVDNILGVLHVKDLFRATLGTNGDELAIEDILRPAFYVPEVMKISELLREFQRRKTHMAIAVDEYGGTAGVVTLEDIIEEIVGEIQDEYDVEEKQFRAISDTKLIADGRVGVDDLEDVLNVKFPEDSGFETLAGFLMYEVGYLPETGAVIEWNDLRFTIKEANPKRIATVEIERQQTVSVPDTYQSKAPSNAVKSRSSE